MGKISTTGLDLRSAFSLAHRKLRDMILLKIVRGTRKPFRRAQYASD
jgi:hypothetical protein